MVNYQNSKIYIIRNNDNNLIYVGATTELYLCKRFEKHKTQKCSIGNYINDPLNNSKWEDWYIELYENCSCNNKNELNKKEGEIQRLFKNDNNYVLINKKITNKSKQEHNKEYRERYKDTIKEQRKQYRINNAEKLKDIAKVYYEKNADKLRQHSKKYREHYKDTIKERQKEKITCECGCEICKIYLSTHKKSQKHLKIMEQLNLAVDVDCSTPSAVAKIDIVSFS